MERPVSELPHDALDGLARVPMDDALDALRHVQRRRVLFALLDRDPVTARADTDGPLDAPERTVRMGHVHLPKLAAYGFVDLDRDGREVTRGPNFGAIRPLLVLLADHEDELPDDWL